jgi:hypothetical protein
VPADPQAALDAGWSPVHSGQDPAFLDTPPGRDFWYYVAFATDACGNVSTASERSAGALSYHLGDVAGGAGPGEGNNLVGTEDISALGAHYGASRGEELYESFLDVGPTSTQTVAGRPLTDGLLGFEDLILFAINYGEVSKGTATPPPAAAADVLTWQVPTVLPPVGETVEVPLVMEGTGAIQGLSATLQWRPSRLALVAAHPGDLLSAQGGASLVLPRDGDTVDLGLLGTREQGIRGRGVVARLVLRVLADGEPGFAVGPVLARDPENGSVEVAVQLAGSETPGRTLPQVTLLHPGYPNPFNPRTQIAFDLARGGPVALRIYAVNGRLVRTLVDEDRPAGRYTEVWTGIDTVGRRVASGTYFVQLQTTEGAQTRRVTLAK